MALRVPTGTRHGSPKAWQCSPALARLCSSVGWRPRIHIQKTIKGFAQHPAAPLPLENLALPGFRASAAPATSAQTSYEATQCSVPVPGCGSSAEWISYSIRNDRTTSRLRNMKYTAPNFSLKPCLRLRSQ